MESRNLLAGDLSVRFEFTDPGGAPVSLLHVGTDFVLRAFVRDIRSNPQGVFQAYLDVNYPSSLVSVGGSITHGSAFGLAGSTSGSTSTSGLIDEVGGIDTDQVAPSPRNAELLLFSVPMHANNSGTINITADLAELPSHSVLFFDTVSGLQLNQIDFSGGTIDVDTAGISVTPTAGLSTTENGGTATFNVVLTNVPTANVTIGLSSSDTSEGTISTNSVTFTPANFSTPQTVTVTGVDDLFVDGPVPFTIITGRGEQYGLALQRTQRGGRVGDESG